jgi:hypothetical protein
LEADLPAVDRLLHVARALGLREIELRDGRNRSRSFVVAESDRWRGASASGDRHRDRHSGVIASRNGS